MPFMKRLLAVLAATAVIIPAFAAKKSKLEPWQDPNVFEENRLPMRATFVTDQQQTLSLNGIWKFHWNENPDVRTKGFESVDYDDSGEFFSSVRDESIIFEGLDARLGIDDVLDAGIALQALRLNERCSN